MSVTLYAVAKTADGMEEPICIVKGTGETLFKAESALCAARPHDCFLCLQATSAQEAVFNAIKYYRDEISHRQDTIRTMRINITELLHGNFPDQEVPPNLDPKIHPRA